MYEQTIAVRQSVAARYMSGVYAWMTGGILLTAIVALACSSSEAFILWLAENPFVMFGLAIAQIGLVIWLSIGVQRMGPQLASGVFLGYSALTGVTFSTLLLAYGMGDVAGAFLATAGSFAALAAYGTTTKRDLSAIGTFCFMGLVGIIIASIVNLFLQNSTVGHIVTYCGVLVFAGLTAWDVQKLNSFGADMPDDPVAIRRGTIIGALTLYLDFINLFLFILRIVGGNRN